jgi:hypothetical protein
MNQALTIAIVCALLYFVPTVVAKWRHIKTPQGPILLNIFLGWTVLGWIGALIWAACAPVAPRSTIARQPHDRGAMYKFGRYISTMRRS